MIRFFLFSHHLCKTPCKSIKETTLWRESCLKLELLWKTSVFGFQLLKWQFRWHRALGWCWPRVCCWPQSRFHPNKRERLTAGEYERRRSSAMHLALGAQRAAAVIILYLRGLGRPWVARRNKVQNCPRISCSFINSVCAHAAPISIDLTDQKRLRDLPCCGRRSFILNAQSLLENGVLWKCSFLHSVQKCWRNFIGRFIAKQR